MPTQDEQEQAREEKDLRWHARTLRRKDLDQVLERWRKRVTDLYGAPEPPRLPIGTDPLPDDIKVDFIMKYRRFYRQHYQGKLPEALDLFDDAFSDLRRCRKILEDNGIPLGNLSDIDALMETTAKQLLEVVKPI